MWSARMARKSGCENTVVPGQKLTLKNILTGEEIACTVIEINERPSGLREVGVEFARLVPKILACSVPTGGLEYPQPEAKRFKISTNVSIH